jgi:hypothetical protein
MFTFRDITLRMIFFLTFFLIFFYAVVFFDVDIQGHNAGRMIIEVLSTYVVYLIY